MSNNKKALLCLILGLVLGSAIGYYLGYDVAWEKAVAQESQKVVAACTPVNI